MVDFDTVYLPPAIRWCNGVNFHFQNYYGTPGPSDVNSERVKDYQVTFPRYTRLSLLREGP